MDINLYKTHPIYFAISIQILKKILDCNKTLSQYIFADGGTLIGIHRYGEYGIMPWDDDIDIGIIANNDIIIELINNCLHNNLTIVVHLKKNINKSFYDNTFRTVHITLSLSESQTNIPLNDRNIISFDELKENIDNMAFFNISIKEELYIEILKKNNLYDVIELEYYDKINKKHLIVPWIDFFPFDFNNVYVKYNHYFGATTLQKQESYNGILFMGFNIVKFHNIDINIFINSIDYLCDLYGDDILNTIEIYGSHNNPLKNKIKIINSNEIINYVKKYNNQIKYYNIFL